MKITPRIRNLILIAVLALCAGPGIVLIINPDILNRGTPGSFEYIRRGEALLDKGKYVDAIKYYEKAYESSPDSDVVRDNLIYAYSSYAAKMAESERYDAGIEYLTKAYDLIQNAHTRRNLALMYAGRAFVRVKRGNWAGAGEDLTASREIADDSDMCKKSLGIILHNYAVTEFKVARETSAILLLKEALLSYEDSHIYELLSDVYYKRTELDQARFYLSKAVKLDPEDKRLAEKYEKVVKEEALSASEKTSILPYFDLRYEKDLKVNTDIMAKILERAYFDVGKDLSYFPVARTVVFFYSEKNFRDIFKMRDIVRAFYDGNIRIPLPDSVSDEKELVSYLYHEYTHAVVSAKTGNNCPVWLSEGIAVYEELKWTRPLAAINISKIIKDRSGISIQTLEEVFRDPSANSLKLALTYMLACTAVEYMVDNWGLKGLDGMLRRIAGGQHAVNAMDDEYLLSEKEFNRRWSDFVMDKYVNISGSAK